MDPQTVPQPAGHTVTVVFRIYVKFIETTDDAANAKVLAHLQQGG